MPDDSDKKTYRSSQWFGHADCDDFVDRSWMKSVLVGKSDVKVAHRSH